MEVQWKFDKLRRISKDVRPAGPLHGRPNQFKRNVLYYLIHTKLLNAFRVFVPACCHPCATHVFACTSECKRRKICNYLSLCTCYYIIWVSGHGWRVPKPNQFNKFNLVVIVLYIDSSDEAGFSFWGQKYNILIFGG